jgi:RNA polymerase sigma-70 factor (ECF subfamily)
METPPERELIALAPGREEEAHAAPAADRDAGLLERLRSGEEAAFAELLDLHSDGMLKVATGLLGSRALAEEVVQETWLAVLRGIERFEGRSSLRTWIYSILTNLARTQAARGRRFVSFSSLLPAGEQHEPAVEPERFLPPTHERWPGHWASPPESWAGAPESRLLASETMEVLKEAIESLPGAQRAAITLRDVQGWTAEEVCAVLGVTDGNQRMLLHRARSRVRASLERYLASAAM